MIKVDNTENIQNQFLLGTIAMASKGQNMWTFVKVYYRKLNVTTTK